MTGQAADNDLRGPVRDSVSKLMHGTYGFESRERFRREAPGYSTDAWSAYAELGLHGLAISEANGGLGGELGDLAVAFEELGGRLALEPLLPTLAFGARLIDALGTPEQAQAWLPSLISGQLMAALAHAEVTGRCGAPPQDTTARAEAGGWVLSGRNRGVEGGDSAGLFVTSARIEGSGATAGETGLFLVAAGVPGVTVRPWRAFDGLGGADVDFGEVRLEPAARLGEAVDAAAALQRALDEATALQCADAVGAMHAANALTLDHVRTRKQFGVAIGGFQALQHRLVDMQIAARLAEALTWQALSALDQERPDATLTVSAAKVRAGGSARLIAEETVQMHGGMGLVEDYPAAHYFARLELFERRWGDADHHLSRFADGRMPNET